MNKTTRNLAESLCGKFIHYNIDNRKQKVVFVKSVVFGTPGVLWFDFNIYDVTENKTNTTITLHRSIVEDLVRHSSYKEKNWELTLIG